MTSCDVCFELIPNDELKVHISQCLNIQMNAYAKINHVESQIKNANLCDVCFEEFDVIDIEEHKIRCYAEQMELYNNSNESSNSNSIVMVELTKHQKIALEYSNGKAKEYSERDYPLLLDKFKNRNLNEDDLDLVINYIQHIAPVIIHLDLVNILEFLCNDIYYRNQFQTSTSRGALSYDMRLDWENKLFNEAYDDVDGFYRVKYGPLNFTNDPHGVSSAKGYGTSYLLLNNDMKMRTTMTFGDSGGGFREIATFNHFNHILNKLTDELLDQIIKLSRGEADNFPCNYGFYIECQYHGDILFERDLETVFVDGSLKNDLKMKPLLDKFKARHKCTVIMMN